MSTETCRMCGDDCTPWLHLKELNGHICRNCVEILNITKHCLNHMMGDLVACQTTEHGKCISKTTSPRTLKKAVYAAIREWCDVQYIKQDTSE